MNLLFGIITQYGEMFYLELTVCHSNLYFVVHRFLRFEDCLVYEHDCLGNRGLNPVDLGKVYRLYIHVDKGGGETLR